MSEISKGALTSENNNSFPNNNTGYITPTILRTFNQNMIDSLVDEISYTADSASVNTKITNLQSWSSSLDATYATDAQLSASVAALSASVAVTDLAQSASIGQLLGFSSSLDATFATDAQLSAVSASLSADKVSNSQTASMSVLFAQTASYVAGASIDTGSFVSTSSFNSYTASNDSKVNTLIAATGSYVTEAESGSFVTSVVAGGTPNVISVTKGNGTINTVTVNNVDSASFAQNANLLDGKDSTEFATTGSNNFKDTQNITGSLFVRSGSIFNISNNTLPLNNPALFLTESQGGQVNIIKGWGENPNAGGAGASQANYTGSLRITGSNNTVSLPQIRATVLGGGVDSQGYISGSDNIIAGNSAGIFLNTGSQLLPKTTNNQISNQSSIIMNFTTSSLAGGHPIIQTNIINAGAVTFNHNSGSLAAASSNIVNGGAITSTQNFVTNTRPSVSSNIINGNGATINHISSSVSFQSNIIGSGLTINNHLSSSGLSNNGLSFTNNTVLGGSSNTPLGVWVSGSQSSNANRTIIDNLIGGKNIIVSSSFVSSSNSSLVSSLIYGQNLVVNGNNSTTSGGSTFVGRFNDSGSLANSQDIVFAVGTGTAAGTRRTGLWIDSGSNATVSGSLTSRGDLTIASGSGDLYMYGHKMFNYGAFQDTTTQSGSANVSASFQFNTTDEGSGVSVANGGDGRPTRLTVANAGTYNIQFSAQIENGASSSDVAIWLKKNGTNVASTTGYATLASNTKLITSWNYVLTLAANDYVEIAYQSTTANTTYAYIAASGNIPAAASIIATVTQVR